MELKRQIKLDLDFEEAQEFEQKSKEDTAYVVARENQIAKRYNRKVETKIHKIGAYLIAELIKNPIKQFSYEGIEAELDLKNIYIDVGDLTYWSGYPFKFAPVKYTDETGRRVYKKGYFWSVRCDRQTTDEVIRRNVRTASTYLHKTDNIEREVALNGYENEKNKESVKQKIKNTFSGLGRVKKLPLSS